MITFERLSQRMNAAGQAAFGIEYNRGYRRDYANTAMWDARAVVLARALARAGWTQEQLRRAARRLRGYATPAGAGYEHHFVATVRRSLGETANAVSNYDVVAFKYLW